MMLLRALLCLGLVLASALPAAAAQRQRPHGVFSASFWRNFVPPPLRATPRVMPRRHAAVSSPAARAQSQRPTAGTDPAARPRSPAHNERESTPSGSDFPPAQTLE
jgi:hypothetical protein